MTKVKGGTITFKITSDGSLKIVEQESKKAAQSVKKVGQSAHSADRALKGTAQASSGASKNFSKMSQGITGGLVPAYATLAANLFAVDALFRFLKSSADFRVLTQGQLAFAAATGVAYKSLAKDLQDATKNMINFRDAAQAGAIGRAAGLSAGQLNELSEAAFTVSMALGRDVTDSFNRLIRGVTKAEPELLDELGIVLRLEEATTKYAASLNLNKNQLSIYQKSQAVVNEVLDQAERKFGKINEIMEPNANAIAQLGVAAEGAIDAIRPIISAIVEPAANFFKDNVTATITALGLFATSIINSVIPSIGELKIRQAEQSQAHIDDLKRMQNEYDKLNAKKKKLGGLPFQEKAKKAIGKKKLGMIGGESARKLERGEALSAREVGAIKGQITKRADELGISEKQKQRIFKQLDQVKGKASVTTQKIKLSTKTMGTSMQMQFKKIQMAGGTAFAFLEKQANRLTRAMSGLMSVMGFLGTAFLIFQIGKGIFDKFFGPDQSQIDQFNDRMNKLKGSVDGFNQELTKMVEVRDRGLITGLADQTKHTAEALQSASLEKTISEYNLLHSRQSVNAEGFRDIAASVSFTFNQLAKLDKRYQEFADTIQAGNKLNEQQELRLAELNKLYNEQGAAFKALTEISGELVKEQNRLVQSLPKVPFQNMISLLMQQKKAFEDLTKGDGGLKEYQADLDLVNAELELFNALQDRQMAIQKDANRLAAASKFSFLAGTNRAQLKVSQEENKLAKMREDLQNQLLQLDKARVDENNILSAGLYDQIEAQTDLVKLQEDSVTAAKMQANAIFMTFNALYAGIEKDLGNAIGAALRGDSSGFEKIGENFAKTLTDAIGQGLSRQLMEDLIPKQLQPKTVQEKIREGANYHAQEVELAIERGGFYHANALFNVSAKQVTALDEITNKILTAQQAVNIRKKQENLDIMGDEEEGTGLFGKRDYQTKVSTKEGIFKYSQSEGFNAASRDFMDAQGFSVEDLAAINKMEQEIAGYRSGRLNANLDPRLTNMQSDAAIAVMQSAQNEVEAQDLEAKIERMYARSEEEYIKFLEDNTFAAQKKADEFNDQIESLRRENKLLDDENKVIDDKLKQTVSMTGGEPTEGEATIKAAEEAAKQKEQDDQTKKGGENLDKFSTGLNQFAGTIGMFMALAGEDQKTAKLMAAVAKIQMAVAIADQVRIAMETKGGLVKQFAALFGFGGTGARQGGIMSKHGRSYSDGGIATGPNSGYGAVLHGREAVIPLPNGRSIPVDIGKGQMGTNNTNITVNMAEGSSEVTSDGSKQLAQAIDAAVQNTLEREMRPGGILGGG